MDSYDLQHNATVRAEWEWAYETVCEDCRFRVMTVDESGTSYECHEDYCELGGGER